jgi:hypothetical protein
MSGAFHYPALGVSPQVDAGQIRWRWLYNLGDPAGDIESSDPVPDIDRIVMRLIA